MPTPDELQGQIDSLTQRLNAALNRISDLEDFAGDHLGLDWGESLVDANSPHPNISVNTIESGGGVIRQDLRGMQVATGNTDFVGWYFVNALVPSPENLTTRYARFRSHIDSDQSVASTLLIDIPSGAGVPKIQLEGNDNYSDITLTANSPGGNAIFKLHSLTGEPQSEFSAGGLVISSLISPAQLTANQNDYAPTDLESAIVLRLSSDASRDITGISAASGYNRVLLVFNVGSFDIVLKDESASSTAANRFALNGDITLQPDNSCGLWYDSTSSRWRAF